MATGVQIELFADDRTLGLTIRHLTIPLYTSPNAPSPSSFSMMTSLAGISHSSIVGDIRKAVAEDFSKRRFFDPLLKMGS